MNNDDDVNPNANIPALIAALQSNNPYVRRCAARVLGIIGDPAAKPALNEVLLDADAGVRAAVSNALANAEDFSVIPDLFDMLGDIRPAIREAADYVLKLAGKNFVTSCLLKSLQHHDDEVRFSAMNAVGRMKERSAVPALIDILKSVYGYDSMGAAHALGDIGDSSAVPALIASLQSYERQAQGANEMARSEAAVALGKIGDPAAIPVLIEELKYFVDSVSYRAAEALKNIGGEAIPLLLEKLQDTDEWTRKGAIKALGHIKDPSTIPALLSCLKDNDHDMRRNILEALAEIDDSASTPALLNVLEDENDPLRPNSLKTLLQVGDVSAIPKVLQTIREMVSEEERGNLADLLNRVEEVPSDLEVRRELMYALHKTSIRFYPFQHASEDSKGCLTSWVYQLRDWLSGKYKE